MKFEAKLVNGTLIKRYKRFLADIELEDGSVITAHTANTGPMTTCFEAGRKALLSFHDNPKRKLKYSLEMIKAPKSWIGVNTHLANTLALEAIDNGTIKELQGYEKIRPEYKVGKSRIDIMLSNGDDPECFVEIKSVTLSGDNDYVLFPDAVTTRGQKHINELIDLKRKGIRTVMLFIVQREDASKFAPAKDIDPTYSDLLDQANSEGVEVLVYQCKLSPSEIKVYKKL